MHDSVMRFVKEHVAEREVRGRRVLEVGSYDFNGSVRPHVEAMAPRYYVGIDIRPGPRVDMVLNVVQLRKSFGPGMFDMVICLEMLEHCLPWRTAVRNMKEVLTPGGVLIFTVRGPGFPLHDHPHDYWRFTLDDVRKMFSDLIIQHLQADGQTGHPGTFLKAIKPTTRWQSAGLDGIEPMPIKGKGN